MSKQRTFGEIVGMEPKVPVGRHCDDDVICSDGAVCKETGVWRDCRDNAHSCSDDAYDADVVIVTDILMEEDKWVTEYCTENEDYASGYDCCINESRQEHGKIVERWLRANYGDASRESPSGPREIRSRVLAGPTDHTRFDGVMNKLVERVVDGIDGSFHCNELQYVGNEYANYSGDGCCLFSASIDEYENQIDFDRHPELQELHNRGRLDDVLNDINCDAIVYRSKRREKNEKTGEYEYVGRETYKMYRDDCEYITTTHCPGGQWQFFVDAEVMTMVVTAAIVELSRSLDSKIA